MNSKELFDAEEYFKNLCSLNKLAKANDFFFCSCSGIDSLQEPLQNFKKKSAFVCVDDTNDGNTFRGPNGGFFKKRTFTIFVMMRYRFDDMSDRRNKLAVCRKLFAQIHSRLLLDRENLNNELVYLNCENVFSREFGQYFLSGCTGLYFMFDVSEPINLCYDGTEWE